MVLGSFNYVSKRAPSNATQMVKEAPHVGPAWRAAEECTYMLGRCTITWDDITHEVNATCELPSKYCTDALEKIEEVWSSTVAHLGTESKGERISEQSSTLSKFPSRA